MYRPSITSESNTVTQGSGVYRLQIGAKINAVQLSERTSGSDMGYTWTYIPHGTQTDPSKPSCSNKNQESRNVYRVSFDVQGLDSQITNEVLTGPIIMIYKKYYRVLLIMTSNKLGVYFQ